MEMKFANNAGKRQQMVDSVPEDEKIKMSIRSYQTWKRINAGFFDDPMETTSREMQQYNERDYQQVDKSNFRVKNRYTEFVEIAVRDKSMHRH